VRVARRNSGNFTNLSDSFAGCWDKFCVISTPRACLDSNATLTQSRASVTPYDLRSARFPGKKIKFCALGAPKFREFCNPFLGFFAQILQYLDAGRFLIRIQT